MMKYVLMTPEILTILMILISLTVEIDATINSYVCYKIYEYIAFQAF